MEAKRGRVMHLRSLVLLAACAAGTAHAQATYQQVGPSSGSYASLTGGTVISPTTSAGVPVNLPFPFRFYDTTYTSAVVSLHGYLTFDGAAAYSSNLGVPHSSSSSSVPKTFLAPWWDNLRAASSGTIISWKVTGSEPRRLWTIEWRDVVTSGNTSKFSFQIRLHESTNQIQFAYGPAAPAGSVTASVGIQKATTEGIAAMTCTSSSSGSCNAANFPINQVIDYLLPPDLTLANLSSDPVGYAGVPFRSSAMLRNQGGRASSAAITRFYLSADTTWDVGDALIGETTPVNIQATEEQLISAVGPIPNGTTPGNYFLIARADPDDAITELVENNNQGGPVTLKVGPPTPDLAISAISAPAQAAPGDTLQIPRVLTNRGNADATSPFKYTYFLSDNSAVTISDLVLGTSGTVASLAAGATDSQTDAVTLPADLHAGRFWIGICVDYDPTATPTTSVTEISEVNNCAGSSTSILVSSGALAIVTTTLAPATQFAPYGLRLQAAGGDSFYTWSQTGGQLPAGLTLSADGDLVGSPSVAGTFGFSVKVQSGGAEQTADLSLQVSPAGLPLVIVDQELPTGQFGRSYEGRLVAVGGKPPYVWSLAPTSRLPIGLGLAHDGHLEGRASELGEFPITVELIDAAGTKATKDLRIRVVSASGLQIAVTRLLPASLGKDHTQVLEAVGGKAPFDWSVVRFQRLAEDPTDQPTLAEAALPAALGLKLSKDTSGRNLLQGVPTMAGLFAITLRVQDAAGSEDLTTLPLRVGYENALAITTLALPDAFVGQPYVARLQHNGEPNSTDMTFSLTCVKQVNSTLDQFGCANGDSQSLPLGLVMDGSGLISGTPSEPKGTTMPVVQTFLVQLVDSQGRRDVRSLSIKVRSDYIPAGCSSSRGALGLALLALLSLARRGRRGA